MHHVLVVAEKNELEKWSASEVYLLLQSECVNENSCESVSAN